MALNLKTLGTRSLSALVFVILLIGSVYWNYYSFTIFFFVVALLGLNEFYKIAEKLGAQPYKAVGFLSGIILYLRFFNFSDFSYTLVPELPTFFKSFIFIVPLLILSTAMLSKKEGSIKNALYTLGGILYVVLPFGLLNTVVFFNAQSWNISDFEPQLILGVIFLIWSNDTFAYLGGSLVGKHKLIERVSPGKTWEGTLIGIFITLGISFTFEYIYPLTELPWSVLGICIPILATVGDLVESKLKREAGIKDSGNIMPGHGGILDRFDSLMFVAPFIYALFMLLRS